MQSRDARSLGPVVGFELSVECLGVYDELMQNRLHAAVVHMRGASQPKMDACIPQKLHKDARGTQKGSNIILAALVGHSAAARKPFR